MAAKGGNAAPMPPEVWYLVPDRGRALRADDRCDGRADDFVRRQGDQVPWPDFAIVMLCTGMLSIATCYCFPTRFALAIYGLIVLLNGPVKLAFRFERARLRSTRSPKSILDVAIRSLS